jgi:hypothetical protein
MLSNSSNKLKEFVRQSLRERLKKLPVEERIKGLSAEEIIRALPPETLEELARRLNANDSPRNQSESRELCADLPHYSYRPC